MSMDVVQYTGVVVPCDRVLELIEKRRNADLDNTKILDSLSEGSIATLEKLPVLLKCEPGVGFDKGDCDFFYVPVGNALESFKGAKSVSGVCHILSDLIYGVHEGFGFSWMDIEAVGNVISEVFAFLYDIESHEISVYYRPDSEEDDACDGDVPEAGTLHFVFDPDACFTKTPTPLGELVGDTVSAWASISN